MEIIGILMAWAAEDWIEYAMKQALSLVDELLVAIGPFHPFYKLLEDDTYKRAKKFFLNPKVKVVEMSCNPNLTPDQNRSVTANRMLKVSDNIKPGNIIWTFDQDEYYSKESIEEILNYIENDNFDLLYVVDRMFCINFNYFILYKHERIDRIKSKDCYFTPIQRMNPLPKKIVTLLDKNPMFHYSMLMGEQLKGIQWLLEDIPKAALWYKKIYNHYDPKNEEYWMRKNHELTGRYGFWRDPKEKLIEKDGHGLFRYEGKHPAILENSFLRKIPDYRTYTRQKPNYKAYLKIVNNVIASKKKFNFKNFLIEISESRTWKNHFLKYTKKLSEIKIFKNLFDLKPK